MSHRRRCVVVSGVTATLESGGDSALVAPADPDNDYYHELDIYRQLLADHRNHDSDHCNHDSDHEVDHRNHDVDHRNHDSDHRNHDVDHRNHDSDHRNYDVDYHNHDSDHRNHDVDHHNHDVDYHNHDSDQQQPSPAPVDIPSECSFHAEEVNAAAGQQTPAVSGSSDDPAIPQHAADDTANEIQALYENIVCRKDVVPGAAGAAAALCQVREVTYLGSFPVARQEPLLSEQLLLMKAWGRSDAALLVVTPAALKLCRPYNNSVRMRLRWRRVCACHVTRSCLAVVSRDPRAPTHRYCHAFAADTPHQAEELGRLVSAAHRAATAPGQSAGDCDVTTYFKPTPLPDSQHQCLYPGTPSSTSSTSYSGASSSGGSNNGILPPGAFVTCPGGNFTPGLSPLDLEPDLRSEPWFCAELTREGAERVLQAGGEEGAFLVRGARGGGLALSLRAPTAPAVRHYRILRSQHGYHIQGLGKEFSSVRALVTHHSVMPERLPCTLRRAPPPPPLPDDL